ncbi:unnamed protein product, partial [marine sediment metagenome]
MMEKRVGFIGLGIMGMPMARNLIKAGLEVVVHDRTISKVEQMVSEGAKKADSPKELAEESPVVITIVSDTPDVESVILGENGIIEGIKADSVVIDMSTISPQATQKIAARLREKGVYMLDAPVSGGEQGAVNGTLSIMVGGDAKIFKRCQPILEAMGKNIIHVGKTLLASLLSRTFVEFGYSVIAIDADPDANLAATLGFPHPEKITPISEMSALIEE